MQLARCLHRRPDALQILEPRTPLGVGLAAEDLAQHRNALATVLVTRQPVLEAGIVEQIRSVQMRDKIWPVSVSLQQHQGDEAAVLGRVGADQWVRRGVAIELRQLHVLEQLRGRDVRTEAPQRHAEQRDIHD